jgi:hypothetical protein
MSEVRAVLRTRLPKDGRVPTTRGGTVPARLRFIGEGADRVTEFRCEAPARGARLRIAGPRWHARVPRGMTPLPPPDERYRVAISDPAVGAILLDASMWEPVRALEAFGADGVLVELRPGVIAIRAGSALVLERRLRAFIDAASRVALLLLGVLEGVVAGAVEEAEGLCRVCGVGLEGEIRRCARCRTPHHADCWAYNDGCAIYACGSRASA